TQRASPRFPGAGFLTPPKPKPKLVFHTQLAHGSATGTVEGFSSIHELYAKIAQVFEISPSEILYCTLSTPKIDMERLLGAQIGLEDFIFAHVKGIQKEVHVYKSEDALGLTITDNGAGYAFIKRIKHGSLMDTVKTVCVGDHIEEINGQNIVGWRHYDVAKMLKELKKEQSFSLKLIEPKKAFGEYLQCSMSLCHRLASDRSRRGGRPWGTLRLRSKGPATVEELVAGPGPRSREGIRPPRFRERWCAFGVRVEAGLNPNEFAVALDEALGDFAFPDEFIFDVWGAIGDAKQGQLQ
uniref:GIPC PDZ domain containing family member 2 n=1 Tax=Vombatus ursinus TaxID=29139 RepID=A0A4X2KYC9_VOMUR